MVDTRPKCVAVIVGLTLQSLAFVHAVPPGWAQADQPANELKRPSYQIRRFDEDWPVLKGVDLKATDDLWETGPAKDSDFPYSAIQYTF